MNILVLNGSPKGDYSITLQTINYLTKIFPEYTFEILHVGQKIRSLEKDFSSAALAIEKADLLLFSYPVYTFIAPYQLHRFIELLKASDVNMDGKYATQLTTSKHFYDVTAHRYIQDNCQDMGLKFIKGLSADMDDLLSKRGQKEALDFFNYVSWCVKNDVYEMIPIPAASSPVSSGNKSKNVVHVPESKKTDKKGDVVIVTNCEDEDTQLQNMIKRFQSKMPRRTRVVNIKKYPFIGGCLGCFNCAVSGKCIYKDGFDEFLRNEIQKTQAIVYAFTIKDHSMGASFKLYDDRQFCNGHRTVTMGMPFGYIVSGNLSSEPNLATIIEARAQVGGNFLAGVATDEANPDREIDQMAASLHYALKTKHCAPQNFYGIGGMKVFRDLIWIMQGMMKADHKFYKAHGQYDFPQKQWPTMLKMYAVGALLANPKLKKKIGSAMNEGMIAPYRKVLDEL